MSVNGEDCTIVTLADQFFCESGCFFKNKTCNMSLVSVIA